MLTEHSRLTTPQSKTTTTTPSAYAGRRTGYASLIANRQSEPLSASGRNSCSSKWKRRGWFVLKTKPHSSSTSPSVISSITLGKQEREARQSTSFASSKECNPGGLKTQEFQNLLLAARTHNGKPGEPASPSWTRGLLTSHPAPSSWIIASLTSDPSSRGCLNSTGLGKSGNPTSKAHRRRSSASYNIPTPLRIISAQPTPPRASTVSHITETPCSQRNTKAMPRSHHQAPSQQTHSPTPSADS